MRRLRIAAYFLSVWVLFAAPLAHAQYSSTNYKTEETSFGTGGDPNVTSTSYSARLAAGALGVGDASSATYRSNAGTVTQDLLYLEINVTVATINLGTLTTTTTGSGTGSFYVRTYVNQLYSIYTMSQPPTSESGKVLNALTTPTASTQGSEQFGINLVKNANFCGAGCDLGADPTNQPDNTFADGAAASGYNTAGLFKYVPGDIIAQSPKTAGNVAGGQTNFTISYMANIKGLTPAGLYTMQHDIVAVGVF